MSQSLSAEVLKVVGAGASAERSDHYELYLELKADPGLPATRLTLVFGTDPAASLVEQIRLHPPGTQKLQPAMLTIR